MHVSTDTATDSLTGLLSRRGLEQYLASYPQTPHPRLTLFSVQIARFGSVNSSLGGSLGDRVLALAARRLTKLFPNTLEKLVLQHQSLL